jgi:tetratricopeptide (TPR) repeat protein
MSDPSASPRPHRTTPLASHAVQLEDAARPPPQRDAPGEPEGARHTQPQRPSWLDAALAGRLRRSADSFHLSPGTVIPGTRYRLLRWLGDGGMGVVYEAEHVDIARRVAVKILRQEVCDHPRVMQLFRDEARAAGRIGSPHIVEVLDFAELPNGRLLYAMELLSGCPLSRELGGRPMPPGRAIAILRQVCKGLASAHAAHIVHRDVKPDNIFLCDRQSRRDAVKLLDFGISIVLAETTATDSDVVGTPHYLAPELVAGLPFDGRVDMYSVGCTAFEMLTGRPPFEGSIQDILLAHASNTPPSIAAVRGDDDVPAELEAVIRRCLAKHPEERYASMDDLEAALCEAQIAARIETAWDDLSLPNVDGERRDHLLRGMPDPAAASIVVPLPRRRSYVVAAIVAALVLAGAAALVRTLTASAPAAVDPLQATLEADARAAAARGAFVYPPPDQPDATTAYQAIRAIESIRSRSARELARGLRREFAGTLGAFGDRLWERPGGLEFAIDAYAQALIFDPDLEPAASRAELTPGQLARLAAKAASHDFSETELIAAEPLLVLAADELVEDPQLLGSVRERIVRRARDRDAALAQLADLTPRIPSPTPPADEPAPAAPATPGPEERPPAPTSAEPDTPSPAPPPGETPRDPAAAARMVAQGRAATRDGRLADAEKLFERALSHDGRSAAAFVGLTEIYFERGAYSKALATGAKAQKLAPNDADLHLLIGDAAFKVFRLDDAERAYERAKELGHPEAERRLAKLAAKRG